MPITIAFNQRKWEIYWNGLKWFEATAFFVVIFSYKFTPFFAIELHWNFVCEKSFLVFARSLINHFNWSKSAKKKSKNWSKTSKIRITWQFPWIVRASPSNDEWDRSTASSKTSKFWISEHLNRFLTFSAKLKNQKKSEIFNISMAQTKLNRKTEFLGMCCSQSDENERVNLFYLSNSSILLKRNQENWSGKTEWWLLNLRNSFHF